MSIPKGIKTVERGGKIRLGSKSVGGGHPRSSGTQPKVIRRDSLTPILPRGMNSGKVIDGNGGDRFKF